VRKGKSIYHIYNGHLNLKRYLSLSIAACEIYADNDENRELLRVLRWGESHNLHLIFDAKDRKSFHSARWQRDYNPDLCFVTSNNNDEPLQTSHPVIPHYLKTTLEFSKS
jgi:hypothetical protein